MEQKLTKHYHPFYMAGEIRDAYSGAPLAKDYTGFCTASGCLFWTYLSPDKERVWEGKKIIRQPWE